MQIVESENKQDSRRYKCLARLISVGSSFDEIAGLLLSDKIISKEELANLRQDSSKAMFLLNAINSGLAKDKIAMVDFEWKILPFESITLTIVTNMQHKEFTYSEI